MLCEEHDKEVEFYCLKHNQLLCSLCVWDHSEHKTQVKLMQGNDLDEYVTILEKYLDRMQ